MNHEEGGGGEKKKKKREVVCDKHKRVRGESAM